MSLSADLEFLAVDGESSSWRPGALAALSRRRPARLSARANLTRRDSCRRCSSRFLSLRVVDGAHAVGVVVDGGILPFVEPLLPGLPPDCRSRKAFANMLDGAWASAADGRLVPGRGVEHRLFARARRAVDPKLRCFAFSRLLRRTSAGVRGSQPGCGSLNGRDRRLGHGRWSRGPP